jgi:biopolymer transport protein ExbD
MAEVSQDSGGSHKKKSGKKRSKKQSTRIDFTPMVDLGFLLITFFMLTTTLSKPQTMEINMPVKDSLPEDEKTKIKASQAMTLILSDDNKIYYYFGIEDPKVMLTDFSNDGVRKILLKENRDRNVQGIDSIPVYKSMFKNGKLKEDEYKKHISRIKAYKDGLIVVIKADDKAKYKNLVDILDEMQITNIGRYAIVDITPTDKEFIKLAFPEYQI